jgi:hypothetical protein
MIRLAISVEGQTESEFCSHILYPFLCDYGISIYSVPVSTSRDIKTGKKHKGGSINMDRIKNEIKHLLPNYDYVTTFYDFYGFAHRPSNNVDKLEKKLYGLFNSPKFIPYIQKYEFETLLFSSPQYFKNRY